MKSVPSPSLSNGPCPSVHPQSLQGGRDARAYFFPIFCTMSESSVSYFICVLQLLVVIDRLIYGIFFRFDFLYAVFFKIIFLAFGFVCHGQTPNLHTSASANAPSDTPPLPPPSLRAALLRDLQPPDHELHDPGGPQEPRQHAPRVSPPPVP